jgi:hypothetical protein
MERERLNPSGEATQERRSKSSEAYSEITSHLPGNENRIAAITTYLH